MATRSVAFNVLNWLARILAALYVLVLGYAWVIESAARQEPRIEATPGSGTALDWFYQWAFWTHIVPALIAIASLAIGWRWKVWGALGFGVLTALGTLSVGTEWAYLPLVAGPPALIAVMFLVARRPRQSVPEQSANSRILL